MRLDSNICLEWNSFRESIIITDWITCRDSNSSEEWNIMLESIRGKYWIMAMDSNTDFEWIKCFDFVLYYYIELRSGL